MATKTIKIAEGIKVITSNEITEVKWFPDVWEMFGWDVENDPNAKECKDIIVREMICFGRIDLTPMNNGNTLILEIIPVKKEDIYCD